MKIIYRERRREEKKEDIILTVKLCVYIKKRNVGFIGKRELARRRDSLSLLSRALSLSCLGLFVVIEGFNFNVKIIHVDVLLLIL